MNTARVRWIAPLLSLSLLAGALWLLHRELAAHHPRDILQAMRALPLSAILAAFGLTAASYAFLPVYDGLGLRYVGHRLGVRRTMFVGFLAYAFSQTLGFALLTGGSLRYRLYSAWGLSAAEVAQVIAIAGTAFWLGVTALAGAVLMVSPGSILGAAGLSPLLGRAVGALLLVVPLSYLAFGITRRRSITIRGWELPPVGGRLK